MTIDQLIAELEKLPYQDRGIYLRVYAHDGSYEEKAIAGWGSYRGYYDQVTLWPCAPDSQNRMQSVKELLDLLKGALGKPMTGWKGGDYVVDGGRPLWIDEPGDCNSIQPLYLQHYVRDGVTDVYIACAEVRVW